MPIRFILGRSGSGKSEQCLSEIRDRLIQQPEGNPLILLVPEQATFQSERSFASHPQLRGIIRAQVLSFHRLAWRVMQAEGGISMLPLTDLGKNLLIYHLMQQRNSDLQSLQSANDSLGLVEKMNQLFTEFTRYQITPERIEQQTMIHGNRLQSNEILRKKIKDVHLIYQDYQKYVSGKYVDAENYLNLLAKFIPQSDYLRDAEVWIDGFHGYTPQELLILAQLFKHCRQVTVTLCVDRSYEATEELDELKLFFPTARTLVELRQLLVQLDLGDPKIEILPTEPLPRFRETPVLQHLEQHFEHRYAISTAHQYTHSSTSSPSTTFSKQLEIREAVHSRAEVQGVARDILRLVREEGVRYREIAVMVRNMNSYEDLLRTTFTDLGIPHFFDQKRTVLHHPLIELIRSAIEVVDKNWTYDAVVRCMKTDLLVPISANKQQMRFYLDRLENFVLAYGIRGSRWTDDKPWTEKRYVSLEQDELEQTEQQLADLQLLNEMRKQVAEPLHAFAQQLQKAIQVKHQVKALFQFLEHIQVADKLAAWGQEALQQGQAEQARYHLQMWNNVVDMLDQLVEMLGEQSLSIEQFANVIETGLAGIQLALVPPTMDQVLIGTMERTRSSGVKDVYMLGVNNGVIPARVQETSMISEEERELLYEMGIRLADSAKSKLLQENFLIYTTFTMASRRLWLSYPLAHEDGEGFLPSELIKQMKRMFPELSVQMLYAEPTRGMTDIQLKSYLVDPRQSLSYFAIQLKQWLSHHPTDVVWFELYNWYLQQPAWRSSLLRVIQAFAYENRETSLTAEMTERLYGNTLTTSVTRMERFAACPFSHFVSYGLRLQERRIHRLQSPDIGQIFHAALHEFIAYLERNHIAWEDLADRDYLTLAGQVVDQLAPKLQGEILLSSSRYQYIARKLKQIIARSSQILGLHVKYGDFQSIGLEIGFGPNERIPSLHLPLSQGKNLEITGRIDRIDHFQILEPERKDYLRIIDYKSSAKQLHLADVTTGLSLQMLTYLDAVLTHSQTWLGHPASPAGVLYFHVQDPIISTKNPVSAEEAQRLLRMEFKTKGYVTSDPHLVALMDKRLLDENGTSDLIPAKFKKDGQFYQSSSVLTEYQWTLLRQNVRQQITEIGSRILQGDLAIQPYRKGKQTACQTCSYKSVCQFDLQMKGNQMKVLQKLTKQQAMKQMEMQSASTYANSFELGEGR